MFEPRTYAAQLALMITSMCCWGSWANALKLTPGWRFQAFYWDYVIGVLIASMAFGTMLGGGSAFLHELAGTVSERCEFCTPGRNYFQCRKSVAGSRHRSGRASRGVSNRHRARLSVIGVLLNYLLAPVANPFLLFSGVFLVALAIVVDAMAFRHRERNSGTVSRMGILHQSAVRRSVLMGVFYPFLARAMQGDGSPRRLFRGALFRHRSRSLARCRSTTG